MFIETLFIYNKLKALNWKQLKCLSGEWIEHIVMCRPWNTSNKIEINYM